MSSPFESAFDPLTVSSASLPSGITFASDSSTETLTWRRFPLSALAIFALPAALFVVVFREFSFFVVPLLFGLLAFYLVLRSTVNETTLTIGADTVSARMGPIAPHRTIELPLSDIKEFSITEHRQSMLVAVVFNNVLGTGGVDGYNVVATTLRGQTQLQIGGTLGTRTKAGFVQDRLNRALDHHRRATSPLSASLQDEALPLIQTVSNDPQLPIIQPTSNQGHNQEQLPTIKPESNLEHD